MKIDKILIWVSLAAAFCAAACENTEPEGAKTKTEIFTSVSDAAYTETETGHYAMTLSNAGNTLRLEFSSSLSDSETPLPDNGTYVFSADGAAGTFSGESIWVSEADGITRKLSSGSFSFEASGNSSTIEGTVSGSDAKQLKFVYTGAVSFTNLSGKGAVSTEFSAAPESVFLGDKYNNGTGCYTLTFKNGENTLFLEFTSSASGLVPPMPDNGTYAYSVNPSSGTFSGESYWISETDGVTRKLGGGSFSFSCNGGVCEVAGVVGGRDGVDLKFSYNGKIEFSDIKGNPDSNAIKCLGCYGTYYGPYYIPSSSDFYIVLYDTVHAKEGDPYSYRIALDFSAKRMSGALMPEMGTYYPDIEGDFAEGTFVQGMLTKDGTFWSVPSGSGSTLFLAVDGFFTIRRTDSGSYQIFGTLKDRYGAEISFDYTGNLSFASEAPGPYTSLTKDYDMDVFYANQKCYYASEELSEWKLYFYTEDSWTSKGETGYFMSFDIPLAPDVTSVPAGTYTASAHVLYPEDNNYIPGYVYTESNAFGSWFVAGTKPWAPAKGGTLVLTDNGDGTMSAEFDVTDDDYIPHHITGSFTGSIPVTSDSEIKPESLPALTNRRIL